MAMEGSAMPSMRFRLIDGKVIGDQFATRHRSAMLHDVEGAAKALRRGETVLLRTTGAQYIELKKMLENDDEGEVKE